MKESNKVFITLIIILVIIIMGLVGYIVYDKVLTNNEINDNEDNNTILRVQDYVTEEDIIEKELYTRKGLKTLSNKDENYRPYYYGGVYERDLSYHQGTVWPYLLMFY